MKRSAIATKIMKVLDTFKISNHETALYLELNWFDLTHDTQTKIMGAASMAVGSTNNNFTFPTINVRLPIIKLEEPRQGKE